MANNYIYPPPPLSYTPSAPTLTTIRAPTFIRQRDDPPTPHNRTQQDSEKFTEEQVNIPHLRRQSTWRVAPGSRVWALVDDWWLWELISWTFAAMCIGGTVILLGIYRGRALPDWPLGLTINAYVSVLGAFAKAALLLPTAEALGQLKFNWFAHKGGRDITDFQVFDQASRGPWGSFLLILRTRGRALAALGAAVMILSIALDPFYQQVVIYSSRSVPVGNSTIARSRLFMAGQYDGPSYNEYGRVYSPDRSVYYFVQSMMYYNNTPKAPDIPLVCPTGNCTWEPFETLGVCSSCADVSHVLSFDCLDAQSDWRTTYDDGALWQYPKNASCGYYLNGTSDNPVLMTGYGTISGNDDTLLARLLPLDFPHGGNMNFYNGSIMFSDIPDPILDVIYVATPGGYDEVRANGTPVAQECNLHWCVKTVQPTVRMGVLGEVVLGTYRNTSRPQYPWAVNWTESNFYYHDTPIIKSRTSDDVFGLASNDTAMDISTCFWESSRSFITAENASSEAWWRYSDEGINSTTLMPASSTPWSHPENVTEHFQRVADTFSSVLRGASNGTDMIGGVAFGPETYLEVRWEWLSLPIALLCFSLVFLMASIFQSRFGEVEVWKTSALAVLLYGLRTENVADNEGQRQPTSRSCSIGGRHAHRRHANNDRMLVRFKRKNGHWRFSRRT